LLAHPRNLRDPGCIIFRFLYKRKIQSSFKKKKVSRERQQHIKPSMGLLEMQGPVELHRSHDTEVSPGSYLLQASFPSSNFLLS
jgi:hypothetical protein